MKEDDLKSLVARITSEVTAEVDKAELERGISLAQLKDHARELGGGKLDSAWTISYNTSGKIADKLTDQLRDVAWTISYSTTSKVADISKPVK